MVAQSRTQKLGNISVPFLETVTILTAVLTLGRDNMNIHVQTDNTSAAQICSSRWCKTNDMLNKYIAYFDFQCSIRYFISGGAEGSQIQSWRSPFGSRKCPSSVQVCNIENTIL